MQKKVLSTDILILDETGSFLWNDVGILFF